MNFRTAGLVILKVRRLMREICGEVLGFPYVCSRPIPLILVFLISSKINEAGIAWGHPTTLDDLTSIFLKHLHSEIPTTPFSSTPLYPESLLILPHLENLTKRGWWTVGSQPAIDGVSSSDEVFGWGPKGGYVYQKAFVEFFATEEDVEKIIQKVNSEGKGWVDYFAVNLQVRIYPSSPSCHLRMHHLQGDLRTNVAIDGRNAVTWGVFPGQEIVQTTIIERESFLFWKVRISESRWTCSYVFYIYVLVGRCFFYVGRMGVVLSPYVSRTRIA
jgi:hypothetical protein